MAGSTVRSTRRAPRGDRRRRRASPGSEAAGAIVLLLTAVAALAWANSPWSAAYEQLWTTRWSIGLGDRVLTEDLRHWVNELLMAVFFFVLALELKREAVHGALADRRAAAVPLLCALGGMVVPALLYLLVAGGDGASGWGVPTATDVAFALGVVALLGPRAPIGLKVFLLTLAIADDVGAIALIALVYSGGIEVRWLAGALAVLLGIVTLLRLGVRHPLVHSAAAVLLWLAVSASGVHATIAGVALGLVTPANAARQTTGIADDSPLTRLERALRPWTSFAVLPLFALANAGVDLGGRELGELAGEPVTHGVVVGLVVGKPLGILLAGAVAVLCLRLPLPTGMGWRHLAGGGLLAGIGFTVSIFIAGLAFEGDGSGAGDADAAKVGILVGSLLAGGLGALLLGVGHRRRCLSASRLESGESASDRSAT